MTGEGEAFLEPGIPERVNSADCIGLTQAFFKITPAGTCVEIEIIAAVSCTAIYAPLLLSQK
jgi:hypothetical protein